MSNLLLVPLTELFVELFVPFRSLVVGSQAKTVHIIRGESIMSVRRAANDFFRPVLRPVAYRTDPKPGPERFLRQRWTPTIGIARMAAQNGNLGITGTIDHRGANKSAMSVNL